jgi:hypothetical protein
VGSVELGMSLSRGGQSYLQNIVLNEWYNFADTRVYGIDVELAKPATAAGNIVGGTAVQIS